MNLPSPGDYIDIHNHDGRAKPGLFCAENLMAHEEREPDDTPGLTYSCGIHPWHTDGDSAELQLDWVDSRSGHGNVFAVGEAGFDKIKGAEPSLQKRIFSYQAELAERLGKPLVIHCVKGWDELFAAHSAVNPKHPWLIHGFRGSTELAEQLLKRNIYISFWFSFILKPESSALVRFLPAGRIFLETDGSGEPIEGIYEKVAADLGLSTELLKEQLYRNFMNFTTGRQ